MMKNAQYSIFLSMVQRKKIIARVMLCSILIQLLPLFPIKATAEEDVPVWDVAITNIVTKTNLETEELVALYGGDTQLVLHEHTPSNQNLIFLLVLLEVTKLQTDESSFFVSDISLILDGTTYEQGENGFLGDHNMTPFPKTEQRVGTQGGYILFEIPQNSTLEEAKLSIGEETLPLSITASKNTTPNTNIPVTEHIMEVQWEIERQILEDYYLGSYTPENPYIILDPYGWAPLSALIMFKTEEPTSISIKVHGKDDYTHIEHTFKEEKTFHQIPVTGLYADYENTVEIVLEHQQERYEYFLETEPLISNSHMVEVNLVTSQPEKMEDGLTFLQCNSGGKYPIAVDVNGETRWILYHQSKQILKRIDTGDLILSLENKLGFYQLDLLGKVFHQYNEPQIIHHDVIQLPTGNFLLSSDHDHYVEDRIVELDRITGEIVQDYDFSNIIQPNRFNSTDNKDWAHMNSFVYQEEASALIVSPRHQGVTKVSYPEEELIWILTHPAELEGMEDKYLTPIGDNFTPPTNQHAVMIMPDQDNNPNTMDIMMFDNNVARLDMPKLDTDKEYSRMVQYRIDEVNMTVEEIWSYGEERGVEYYSSVLGDADFLSKGTVLGTFGYRDYTVTQSGRIFNTGTVMEVDKETNEVVFEIDVKFSDKAGVYRSERLPLYPNSWDFSLYTTKGEVKARNNEERMQTEVDIYQISYQSPIANLSGSLSPTFNNTFYDLDVSGKATMNQKNNEEYISKLVFQSDACSFAIPLESNDFNVAIPYALLEDILPPAVYRLGILVESGTMSEYKEYDYYFTMEASSALVPTEDLIQEQEVITKTLERMYLAGDYSFQDPLIVVDPYGIAPLSAIAIFKTTQPAQISVEVDGLREGETLSNHYSQYMTTHYIPIYGLYADEETTVRLTLTHGNGESEVNEFSLAGKALPQDFTSMEVLYSDPLHMAEGITFYLRQHLNNYFFALDSQGEVRFAFSIKGLALASGVDTLENGNILVASEKTAGSYYKNSFYEMDLTGHIYGEYLLDGVHHDVIESNNGNFLALGNDINGSVKEDTLYEIERNTGNIVHIWDFDDVLPVEQYNEQGNRIAPEVYNFNAHDWLHMNAVDQHPDTDEILISGRNHALVISMNYSGEINYLLGDPSVPLPEDLQEKLLTPVNQDVEWFYGQHNAHFLENGDIMVFDNGAYRSKTLDEQIDSATAGYSRVVIYRVNQEDMTVEQIWEYGAELGSSHLSTYLSGARQLGEDHYLINFGGQVFNEEGQASYTIGDTLTGHSACIQYEIKNGEIVYQSGYEDLTHNANVYRVERINPYITDQQLNYFTLPQRYGSLQSFGLTTLESSLPIDIENSEVNSAIFADNGVQLEYQIQVSEYNSHMDNWILFQSETAVYAIAIEQGTMLTGVISNVELPTGNYKLYLQQGELLSDLGVTWGNGIEIKTSTLNPVYVKTLDTEAESSEPNETKLVQTSASNPENDVSESKNRSHYMQGVLLFVLLFGSLFFLTGSSIGELEQKNNATKEKRE